MFFTPFSAVWRRCERSEQLVELTHSYYDSFCNGFQDNESSDD
jgi:hypothetical protein